MCIRDSHIRIVKRPRRSSGRTPRNRRLAYLYERPVDDIGIRMVGRDVKEPAKEKGRCADAPEYRKQADQRKEIEDFHGKGHDTPPNSRRCSSSGQFVLASDTQFS